MNQDIFFLKETFKLAKKGTGWTNPNPLVGTVIVKNGRVIGRGFHHKIGHPHAEVEALNNLTENPKGATLYVNLEPCNIFGKTPPCTETIIKSGIKKVVCCSLDPNPKISGRGLNELKKANIETSVGILETEARILNETFFTFHEKKRPFVAIKFATSIDGKMTTSLGDSKWITNEKARKYARGLRGKYQAILVGINTVLSDNPNLGVRVKGKKDPIRIILDPRLRIPSNSNVLRDTNTIIATTEKADNFKKKQLKDKGFTLLDFDSKEIDIKKLLSVLREKGIISILVEGGGKTLGYFIDTGVIDKVYAFHAPLILGGKKAVSIGGNGILDIQKAIQLKNLTYKKFADNLLTIGYAEK